MTPTFAEATAVKATGSHTYAAHFPSEWCIGSVPHGGVVTSTILRVVATHFSTTLAAQNQPHTITLHAEFLRRTRMGDVTFTVQDSKLGRQTSTVHVTLIQDGRDEVVAYVTNANMGVETGFTLETGWALHPPPPEPPVDFAKLTSEGEDANWVLLRDLPHAKLRRALNRILMHIPRGGQVQPNVIDQWVRLESGERFTMEALGYVADVWPHMVESLVIRQKQLQGKKDGDARLPWLWYPTLILNLDVKKALPPEGVEWLHVRVHTKQIKNGRNDYELVIFDAKGEIVALSHHVTMVLDGSRNLASRGESKI